jgi:hypothetical protein
VIGSQRFSFLIILSSFRLFSETLERESECMRDVSLNHSALHSDSEIRLEVFLCLAFVPVWE